MSERSDETEEQEIHPIFQSLAAGACHHHADSSGWFWRALFPPSWASALLCVL